MPTLLDQNPLWEKLAPIQKLYINLASYRFMVETLKGCFLCTDWDTFSGELNPPNATEVTTDYIKFCVDADLKTDNKSQPQQLTLHHKGGEGL